jgi:hypothetical protein
MTHPVHISQNTFVKYPKREMGKRIILSSYGDGNGGAGHARLGKGSDGQRHEGDRFSICSPFPFPIG